MSSIAVVIPCLDEAATIGAVVESFRRQLPGAQVHVFDNASTDGSGAIAQAAGAVVHLVPQPGKGEVVRCAFRDVDADVYVMVDGDETYPAEEVHRLMEPVARGQADMAVGARMAQPEAGSFRPMHVAGNRLVVRTINAAFGARLTDVMSGYRAFSRRFAKTMPVLSEGFEIETEMTLHALEHRLPIVEVPVPYRARPAGSFSKLRTVHDGSRVLRTIAALFRHYRPFTFFGGIALVFLLVGLVAGIAVTVEFMEYGQVIGVARAVVSVACGILGLLAFVTGVILETVNRRSRELYVLLADHVLHRPDVR
jgi:glycosyltransferase involved in cell wall biosynthesis